MNSYNVFCLSLLVLFGCSTPNLSKGPDAPLIRQIVLSDLTLFNFGKDPAGSVEAKLGRPNNIVAVSSALDLWIYDDQSGQRATIFVDHVLGKILSATLLLRDSEPLAELDAAKSYFKGSKFLVQDAPWIARHERSSDATYLDSASGISLTVNKSNHTVSMIGLTEPIIAHSGLVKSQ